MMNSNIVTVVEFQQQACAHSQSCDTTALCWVIWIVCAGGAADLQASYGEAGDHSAQITSAAHQTEVTHGR